MSQHLRSTRSSRPSSTPYWRDSYRRRRSYPSATAPRWLSSTSATSKCVPKAIIPHCAIPRGSRRSDRVQATCFPHKENSCMLGPSAPYITEPPVQPTHKRDRKNIAVQPLLGGLDPGLEPVTLPALWLDQHDPRCLHE